MTARLTRTVLCLLSGCTGKPGGTEDWTASEFIIPSGYSVVSIRGFDPEAGTVTVFAYRYADDTPCLLTAEEDGLIRERTALPGADRLTGLTWLGDGGFMGIREIDGEQIAERYGPDGSLTGSFSADRLLAPYLSGAGEGEAVNPDAVKTNGRKNRRIFMLSDGRGGLIFQASSVLFFCPGSAEALFDGGGEALLQDRIRALPLPKEPVEIRSEDPPLLSPDGTLFVRWLVERGQRGAFLNPETGEVLCVFPLPYHTRIPGFDGSGRLLFTEGSGIMALSPAEKPAPALHVLDRSGLNLPRNASVCLLPTGTVPGEEAAALFWEGAKDPEAARKREGESDSAYAARTASLPRVTRILIFRRPA